MESEVLLLDDLPECITPDEGIASSNISDATTRVEVRSVIILLYAFLFLFGLIANVGVLSAVFRNRRLRSARNIFLLNLIITDMQLLFTNLPITSWYALTKNWVFGSTMCHLMPISTSCSVFVTSWSLTAIAIDKFLHIIDPTKAPVTKRQALIVTMLVWTLAALLNLPYSMSYELVNGSFYNTSGRPWCGEFCDETNWYSETLRKLYGVMTILLQYFFPLLIISYCYFRILSKVSKDMIIANAQFSQSLSQKQRMEAMGRKKRVNYILMAMVGTFAICWLPLNMLNILKDFGVQPQIINSQPFLCAIFAHLVAMSMVVWNPLLFFWLTRKQKRMLGLSRIINTSEVVASFASRLSSLRRPSTRRPSHVVATSNNNNNNNNNNSNGNGVASNKLNRRQGTVDSEVSTTGTRPLITNHHSELYAKASNGLAPPIEDSHYL